MTDNVITINLSQPTELEFEMTTNGLNKDSDVPTVRFMLIDADKGISYVFPCSKKGKKQWVATLPKLDVELENDHTFCIECIIDGYYFTPAQGIVNFVDELTAKITSPVKEPVDQKDSKFAKIIKDIKGEKVDKIIKNIKDAKDAKVNEGAEGADITGQYAPTNDLLKPERKPKDSSAKIPKTEPMDELIDRDKLDADFTPGEGGRQYAQTDDVDFENPRELVDKILSREKTTGLADIERATGKNGKLFTRDPEGKIVIPGLETKEQKERIDVLNQKIKDVLRQK